MKQPLIPFWIVLGMKNEATPESAWTVIRPVIHPDPKKNNRPTCPVLNKTQQGAGGGASINAYPGSECNRYTLVLFMCSYGSLLVKCKICDKFRIIFNKLLWPLKVTRVKGVISFWSYCHVFCFKTSLVV
jgi:hypothetical protein